MTAAAGALAWPELLALGGGEKQHGPTPRRRQRAREQGQGWRSPEFQTATALAVTVLVFTWYLPWAGRQAVGWERWALTLPVGPGFDAEVWAIGQQALSAVVELAAPLALAAAAVGVGIAAWQSGFRWQFARLVPDFGRINPVTGLARIFSRQGLWQLMEGLLKLLAMGTVVGVYLAGNLGPLATMSGMPLSQAMGVGERLAVGAMVRGALAYWAIAVVDLVVQIRRFEASLRMTTQELRDEFRETEGDPKIRGRRREIMRRLARSGLSAVSRATVVVTNPEHYAVALAWDEATMVAPTVVAKGEGETALRIRELAEESAVPVVANPPLARALYLVPIGQPIPEEHYRVVAEIIAFVWRRRRGAIHE
ncbi:MAG: EscU/YscU/HrcU family type III secretion system export apparatus switch protein [Firmicutes bacterium]|nr:EscU/YscU/HrcU family type III secretion system export apparatus switch protein [Alicyclobacillaceae bacterium]MCL6497307.1 EscU/YscU/HrcU family type III secretion system export apparatus switch protein [Bacillota bacterium]